MDPQRTRKKGRHLWTFPMFNTKHDQYLQLLLVPGDHEKVKDQVAIFMRYFDGLKTTFYRLFFVRVIHSFNKYCNILFYFCFV